MDDKVMSKEALDYFEREGLSQYFKATPTLALDAYQTIDPENKIPYGSDVEDLVRLHKLIRTRRVLTILEFGVGYSTLVMADALVKNKTDYEMQFKGLDIRCLNPFHLFCVDADEKWVDIARERIPEHLAEIVTFSISEVYMGTFNDRICHYFKKLPNIVPDFIYLDGPAGTQVNGSINGSDFAENYERTVVSGDLLRLEPTFTPGTFIIVDGRTNNARFLKNNFQREWRSNEDAEADITIFELIEKPLGIHNKNRLAFQGLNI